MSASHADLIAQRESVMDRADHALDRAWPQRVGDDYVREMQSAATELESIIEEMRSYGVGPVETGRTYRYLGSIYSDLAPALGKQMLSTAIQAYNEAETRLKGHADALECAKLDFNYANSLRQYDPNDIEKLNEAEHRFLAARSVFEEQSPQHIGAVDEALRSTRGLREIATMFVGMKQNRREMDSLEKELKAGADVAEVAAKFQELTERDGGYAGMYANVQRLIADLPESAKQSEEFSKLTEQMGSLTELIQEGTGPADPMEREITQLLREKLNKEVDSGKVSSDRADALASVLDNFGNLLGGVDDIQSLMKRVADIRASASSLFESLHYMSHGIDRPPDGSRAAQLVELCWALRLFIIEEMNQRGKSDGESKTSSDLNVRSAEVDKRIYKAGNYDSSAITVDREVLRPFALAVRDFAARHHPMLVKPIWSGAAKQTSTSALLYSGPDDGRQLVENICSKIGFELMSTPTNKIFDVARWEQLQKAYVAIFDLRAAAGPARAAVAYELGIARTLGKPVVVIATADQAIPFDIDVQPLLLSDSSTDASAIAEAIDLSAAWTMQRPSSSSDSIVSSIGEILRRYPIPHADTFVDQTLKQLEQLQANPDPVAVSSTLRTLVSFLDEDGLMLIHPVWRPTYAEQDQPRLFHVMPFRPDWADEAAERVESICTAVDVQYVRGDRVKDANVIRSIWKEINLATHVLVDLTDFNENVALELGIAHTLGRPTLMTGQGDTVERLFPMVSKLRFYPYPGTSSVQLDEAVKNLLV